MALDLKLPENQLKILQTDQEKKKNPKVIIFSQ